MKKTEIKKQNENYYCKKLDETVVITRRRLIQGMKKLRPSGIVGCSHAIKCDVSSHTSKSISFDFKKCVVYISERR